MKKFSKVAIGGTFDELHRGHKALLMKAFDVGENVIVGLCSDEFVLKLGKPHMTAPYAERLGDLKQFLKGLGVTERTEIIPLNDPFGPTLTSKSIEALVVSEETETAAEAINEKRSKAGLPPLKIVAINMIPAENFSPISTTKIRKGEIDREGRMLRK